QRPQNPQLGSAQIDHPGAGGRAKPRTYDVCQWEEPHMNTTELETVWAPRVLSILRIVAALIFMVHGMMKLFGFPPSDRPQPELFSLLGLSGVPELFARIRLVLGC